MNLFYFRYLVVCLFLAPGFCCSEVNNFSISDNDLLQIYDDMHTKHEARPDGVPDNYDWSSSPRVGVGNNPTSDYSALTGWGHIFTNRDCPSDTVVQLRNLRTYLLSKKTARWRYLQGGAIHGRIYRADFHNNENKSAGYQVNSDVLEVKVPQGTAFHFWSKSSRPGIDYDDIAGILVVFEARAESTEFNSCSPLLAGAGADYWKSKNAEWDNFLTNRDAAIGRLKIVKDNWGWFGMTTASKRELIIFNNQDLGLLK